MTEIRRSPQISELNDDECAALLSRHHVGRLAFSFQDRVDITPIHYVFFGGRVYGRTQMGAKVDVLSHHPWVAFEVDEVDALFDWRSVVVRGQITFPDPEGTADERAQFALGVAAFQELVPDAFADGDPTPDLDLVFCVHVQEMSGRQAVQQGREPQARQQPNG